MCEELEQTIEVEGVPKQFQGQRQDLQGGSERAGFAQAVPCLSSNHQLVIKTSPLHARHDQCWQFLVYLVC